MVKPVAAMSRPQSAHELEVALLGTRRILSTVLAVTPPTAKWFAVIMLSAASSGFTFRASSSTRHLKESGTVRSAVANAPMLNDASHPHIQSFTPTQDKIYFEPLFQYISTIFC